jgi:hypothetical protein
LSAPVAVAAGRVAHRLENRLEPFRRDLRFGGGADRGFAELDDRADREAGRDRAADAFRPALQFRSGPLDLGNLVGEFRRVADEPDDDVEGARHYRRRARASARRR